MSREKRVEGMALILEGICSDVPIEVCETTPCNYCRAERLYNAGYRKQSEVIDEFVKQLLDAFPEANRDARCPAIYYDDYRYIIEELAEKMKGGAE